MNRSRRTLIFAAVMLFAVSTGTATAVAAETESTVQTEAPGQTEVTDQTGTTGQTGSESTGQTEATDQTETGSTGQTETTVPEQPAWQVFAEPSAKQGLQTEGEYKVYYDSSGYLKTGWQKIKKSVYYFRPEAVDGPRGSAVTGFQEIDGYGYYFDENGVLKTGWQTISKKRYYFTPSGELGTLGRMYIGLNKIGKSRYYFDESGCMKTGWVTYGGKKYFFTKKKSSKTYGAAYTGWHTISGAKYYFSSKGVMRKSRWISKKYYVGADGKMLKNCVTPDGYFVDSKGVRGKRANGFVKIGKKTYYYSNGKMAVGLKKINGKRYYFKSNGVRQNTGMITVCKHKYYIKNGVIQTGWVTYKGKRYYFKKNGRMAVNTTVNGVRIGPDGTSAVSILLIAGHGQGDPGASATIGSKYYQEDKLTRSFANLIYKQLQAVAPGLNVVMYDQDYDCYQVNSGKKSGPDTDFETYSYVLEIHFNATDTANKDSKGDGKTKGTGMYINSAKKDTELDKKIVAAVAKAGGLSIWGGGTGLMKSSTLYNARTIQAMGVSYGLLETVFIDDKDDMDKYNKNKTAMAKAAAEAISDYFGS